MKLLSVRTFILLLLASALILFLDTKRVLDPGRMVASTVVMPVQYVFYQGKLALGNAFSFATFWRSGEARIKNLELRNLELAGYKNQAEALERESQGLRKQLAAAGALPQ